MYQKMSNTCRKSLKNQFDFSVPELNEIESFISNNIDKTAIEIIENLMKDSNLNDRQKVMISYTLGSSVGAESVIQDLEKISAKKVDPITNIRIGQGG